MAKETTHLQKNLFFGSIVVLMYVCFIHITFYYELQAQFLRIIMELVTIPIFIASLVIPIWVVYLLFKQKASQKKLAYLTLLISVISIAIIAYSMF
jgi:hypothetical protein